MNIDSEAADAALSFEKRNVSMRFRVFLSNPQIQFTRDKDQSFFRNPEMMHFIVKLRVENFILVQGEPITEMYIVAVRTEISQVVRPDDNRSLIHFGKDLLICEYHRV